MSQDLVPNVGAPPELSSDVRPPLAGFVMAPPPTEAAWELGCHPVFSTLGIQSYRTSGPVMCLALLLASAIDWIPFLTSGSLRLEELACHGAPVWTHSHTGSVPSSRLPAVSSVYDGGRMSVWSPWKEFISRSHKTGCLTRIGVSSRTATAPGMGRSQPPRPSM